MALKAVTLCDRRLFSAGAQGRRYARLPGGFEDLARALTVAYTPATPTTRSAAWPGCPANG
jgi:hypothetical protein